MLGKILPLLLIMAGTGAGVGAGLVLKPDAPPEETEMAHCDPGSDGATVDAALPEATEAEGPATTEFVKLNNQFVVPVVDADRVSALVVLSISLEVAAGQTEAVYLREPKIRDAFLSVLFDHANAGGFDGAFTSSTAMIVLRDALREAAVKTLGRTVSSVLITDIVRQDT